MGINSVKSKYEKKLLQLANVIGVGIGMKADKMVIKVYVTSNFRKSLMKERIPETLDGYEIHIEVMGDLISQD